MDLENKIILFDIGSHDGNEFFDIAKKNSDVIVYAFEPTPWACESIRNKVKDLDNFIVIEKAVSIINENKDLIISSSDINKQDSGCNSLQSFSKDVK
jgi:FkbM family methyltransferase